MGYENLYRERLLHGWSSLAPSGSIQDIRFRPMGDRISVEYALESQSRATERQTYSGTLSHPEQNGSRPDP